MNAVRVVNRLVRGVRRLLKLALVVVIVLTLVVTGLLAWVTGRSMPQATGAIRLAGLHAPVTVMRDANGIAQIVADVPHDLFMAQGYVHAQERFWQMEVWRHIGAGRLAELFGPTAVKRDRFIRTLGWRQAGQRDLEASSPETRAALQAYADGVNVWIDQHKGNLGLSFVLEGLMFGKGGGIGGYDPEPWTPLDSATWSKVQAWNLGGNLDTEIFRLRMDAKLEDRQLTNALFPPYPSDGPVEIPSKPTGSGGPSSVGVSRGAGSAGKPEEGAAGESAALADSRVADGWRRIGATAHELLAGTGLNGGGGLDDGIGSNNWVVGPSKSASGHALLANDPHLGLDMPSVWFMNGLRCRTVRAACPYDVVGVSFPGVPSVILGHNARIAWGATNVGPDVQDLFEERLDPDDPGHYMFRGASVPFTTRHETIRVAGGADVQVDVRSTGHGPLISDVDDALKATGALYSLRWTALTEPDRILDTFFAINRAANWNDFHAALSSYGTPSQNFIYADVDGHIGLQVPGRIPLRADPHDLGDRPVPGWDGDHEWLGYARYEDMPKLLDPPSGRIVTANAAPVDARSSIFMGQEWDPGYRARRILELLDAAATAGGVTRESMRSIQIDTKVGRAPLVVDRLEGAAPATDDGRIVLQRMRDWDGSCPIESQGCAAYMTFEYRLLRGAFDDELGNDLAREYVGSPPSWQALIALLNDPSSTWWDDRSTPDRQETMLDVVSTALDTAGSTLRAEFGDPGSWTWGREHTISFQEGTLGQGGIGPVNWYLNRGTYPVAGAAGAVNNTYYQFQSAYRDPDDPTYRPGGLRTIFDVTNGPSYRLTIDMGDLDGAGIVTTTGQSGNPFDRHYGDLIDAWLAGRLVPLSFSSAALNATATSTLSLTP
jgi:penicillin amidase